MILQGEYMISVIIPTLNAENEIYKLISKLNSQTKRPDEIIVVDSESEDDTVKICRQFENVHCISVKRSDFDHGKTRDFALRESKGEYIVFMTQDAIPYDDLLIEKIIKPFLQDDRIGIVSARQIPKENASQYEKLIRKYNYPSESYIRKKEDISTLGIKAFFSSDVCSAYRRTYYFDCGGFEYPLKTNEDMFMSAAMLRKNYRIMYCADAIVYHSHNFTLKQQYMRNYIQGYEIEKHKELLENVSINNEGKKLAKVVSSELLKRGYIFSFVRFGFDCCARFLGNKNGKNSYVHEYKNKRNQKNKC